MQEYERAVIFRWKENYDFKTLEHYHKDYDESNELNDDKYDAHDNGENANYKQGSADYALEEHADPASSSSSRALTGFIFFTPAGDCLHDWRRFCPIFFICGIWLVWLEEAFFLRR